tara:strand:+ start:413 stop:604 length:192 start_codon:yes stop_codon:yes gene_type:complete
MTIAKGSGEGRISFKENKSNLGATQAIIFGSFVSAIASATALGYIAYVSSPLFQDYFLKIVYR